jgi:hypothetical protein
MELQCFVCAYASDYKVSVLGNDPEAGTRCSGVCFDCSIIVCNGHGHRLKSPKHFICILCVPDHIRRREFAPRDPNDPIEPPVTQEMVTDAIAFAPEPVVAKVGKAMTEYLESKHLGYNADLGQEGLEAAANAFSDATGVTQLLKAIELGRILEGS